MAKSLGQIHTVSHEFAGTVYSLAATEQFLIDLPGELTRQLQHMVRMMSSFKVCGIDMSIAPIANTSDVAASMSGQLKYYAPTAGRVAALQAAYGSVRRMMKLAGVNPRDSVTYDFRPIISDPADFQNGADIGNQASIEDNGLATCLRSGPAGAQTVFDTYNDGIYPKDGVGTPAVFAPGFDIGLRSNVASNDWTLNEKVMLEARSSPVAHEVFEMIPFQLAYNSADSTSQLPTAVEFEWRPDPALYLSILTGQIIIEIEESALLHEGVLSPQSLQLAVSVHVAGWKSILGSGKKKRRSKKGKSHGRKRRSKK